jgi:hypothetical protein
MADAMFEATKYGEALRSILRLGGDGERPMPLAIAGCTSEAARDELKKHTPVSLFPRAYAPEAALAGLFLYFGCFDESHSISQDLASVEGSYWHGILHRQEPDPGNAAYWFRRVGSHVVFPSLARGGALAFEAITGHSAPFIKAARWDPFAFIDYCEAARRGTQSQDREVAMQIQLLEWQLLFDYCASPRA